MRLSLLDRANAAGRQDLIALANRKCDRAPFDENVDAAWSELEHLLDQAGLM